MDFILSFGERGDTPSPGGFSQRVRNCLEIKELSFWWARRVRKGMKGKRIGNRRFHWVQAEKREPTPWCHPAVFRKSVDASEWKRVMKRSWCKERKERAKSAAGKSQLQVKAEIFG
jgi:hypothetical protein